MAISSLETIRGFENIGSIPKISFEKETAEKGFSQLLSDSIEQVNQYIGQADKQATALVSGKTENIHETMIALEKADTAFKLMMQVRNKAIEAYHEVMRMQV